MHHSLWLIICSWMWMLKGDWACLIAVAGPSFFSEFHFLPRFTVHTTSQRMSQHFSWPAFKYDVFKSSMKGAKWQFVNPCWWKGLWLPHGCPSDRSCLINYSDFVVTFRMESAIEDWKSFTLMAIAPCQRSPVAPPSLIFRAFKVRHTQRRPVIADPHSINAI